MNQDNTSPQPVSVTTEPRAVTLVACTVTALVALMRDQDGERCELLWRLQHMVGSGIQGIAAAVTSGKRASRRSEH